MPASLRVGWRVAMLLPALGLLSLLPGSGRPGTPPHETDGLFRRSILVAHAERTDLSHPGIHTHRNYVEFYIGNTHILDILKDRDVFHRRARHVMIIGHSRLDTGHAALPFRLPLLGEPLAHLGSYGPIDGQLQGLPFWPWEDYRKIDARYIRIIVPSRLVNWIMQQDAATRRRYRDPRNYSLEVRWEEPTGPGKG